MTPSQRQNIFVRPEVPEPLKLKLGFSLLVDECKNLGVERAWVVCSKRETLKGIQMATALGVGPSAAIFEGKIAKVNDVEIIGKYATRMPTIGDHLPILAAYLSAEDLAQVDALYSVTSLVVVPIRYPHRR
jgi:hypothetical protein